MRWPKLQELFSGVSPVLLLPLILLVALGLRVYGMDWDQGYGFHPDERSLYMRADCMYRVLTEAPGHSDCIREYPETQPGLPSVSTFFDADESPLNPHWFPLGSILIYLIVAVRFVVEPFADVGSLLAMGYAGRSIMVLADLGTVLMAYVLGRRIWGRGVGLLASALVALAVVHVQHAHFYRPEPLLVFFLTTVFWAMLRMMERRRLRDSLLLGLLVGLAMAPKVSVLPLVLPLAAAYGYRLFSGPGGGWARPSAAQMLQVAGHAAAAGAVALGVFAVTTPYALMDFTTFIGETAWQANMARNAGTVPFTVQYIDSTPFLYELKQTTVWGLGLPLGIAAWAGLLFTAWRVTRGGPSPAGTPPSPIEGEGVAQWSPSGEGGALPTRAGELLLLAWVVPNFLMLGVFEVKFLRYIFPLMPFLILMGSSMLVWSVVRSRELAGRLAESGRETHPDPLPLEERRLAARTLGRRLPKVAVAAVVVVLLGTAAYALAFGNVYREPHPAIKASRWINENVPRGATIVTDNHWDEGIPDIYGYNVRQVPIYEPDSLRKMDVIAEHLAMGDYLVFYSNRTYGSVSRVPERYPWSARYYRLLFSEQLGYVPEAVFTTYPSLLGVSLVDDTFGRAGIPEPESIRAMTSSGVTLDLGYADENVVGYDHPKVILLRNDGGLSRDRLFEMLTEGPLAAEQGLMMGPDLKRAQREGGSWSEIVSRDSWTNAAPVLAWLLLLELIYLAALPLALFLFRPLPDRGIVLARILGVLGVAYGAWLLASLGWMGFSRLSVLVGVLAVASLSAAVLAVRWRDTLDFLRRSWRLLAVGEVLFLAAFLSFTAVRAANPDLWHAYLGGEKPMDFAYLNAVLRSTYMPPYDPWFAGGYLNYYYWGQFVVAVFIKAAGMAPSVAYNLAVPTLFALTVTAAYSLVYNLAAGLRREEAGGDEPGRSSTGIGERAPVPRSLDYPRRPLRRLADAGASAWARLVSVRTPWRQGVAWGPVAAGVMGGLLVAVAGNLDQVAQAVRGGFDTVFLGEAFPSLAHLSDFWRSSRMLPVADSATPSALTFWLPGDRGPEAGHHITEFPFFSFLFADLHAHVIVIPFTLLALGLGFSLLAGLKDGGRGWLAATVAALGVAVGALWAINSWDYPAYLLLSLALLGLAVYSKAGRPLAMALTFVVLGALAVAIGIVAFLPFHASYQPYPTGIDVARWPTPLLNFLGIHGLFLFLIVSFLAYLSRRRIAGAVEAVVGLLRAGPGGWMGAVSGLRGLSWDGAAAIAGTLVAIYLGAAGYWTAALLFLVLVPAAWALRDALAGTRSSRGNPCGCPGGGRPQGAPLPDSGFRRNDGYDILPLVLIVMGLLIAIGVEFVRVQDDIGRMNTLFKYYLEVWVLFALASAYALYYFARLGAFSLRRVSPARAVWVGLLLIVLASSFTYPVLGTKSRLAHRFDTANATLDGADFMQRAVYSREGPDIKLRWDYEAIRWLQDNVQGSPVVLEAHGDQYSWGARVANYTGLPTVLGWPWHQIQQRMRYADAVHRRAADVREMYDTADVDRALDLLTAYEVRYVVVGDLERAYYRPAGLAKFDAMAQGGLARVVYENPGTRIYEGLWYN